MIPQLVLWQCQCGQFNRTHFPSEKDVLRLNDSPNTWSLSQDAILSSVASTIEAVGNRKCKYCKGIRAIVVYADGGWSCHAFAYDLDTSVGKQVQILLMGGAKQKGGE